MVEYTKSMDLQEDEGVLALGSIIVGLHKLLEHPQPTNQVGKASPPARNCCHCTEVAASQWCHALVIVIDGPTATPAVMPCGAA